MDLDLIFSRWWTAVRNQRLLWWFLLIQAGVSGLMGAGMNLVSTMLTEDAFLPQTNPILAAGLLLGVTLVAILAVVVGFVLPVGTLRIARRVYLRPEVPVTWQDIRPHLFRLILREFGTRMLWAFGLGFLVGFPLIGALILSVIVEMLWQTGSETSGAILGFGAMLFSLGLCLLVPFVLLLLPFMQSTQLAAVLEEEYSWTEALSRGFTLGRRKYGSWWLALGVIFLLWLLLILVLILPLTVAENVVDVLLGDVSYAATLVLVPLLNFLQSAISGVLGLAGTLAWGLVYMHLRERFLEEAPAPPAATQPPELPTPQAPEEEDASPADSSADAATDEEEPPSDARTPS